MNMMKIKMKGTSRCYFGAAPDQLKNTGTIQQGQAVEPMLVQCWDSVADGGPTLNQHRFNISSLLDGEIL